MGDLSEHFNRAEFACACGCGFDTVDAATLAVVEAVRRHFRAPVVVTSGCRCPEHNRRIGGADHSQHKYARAADIVVNGVGPSRVADYVESLMPSAGGVGRYNGFTHVDTRTNGPARWDNR